MSAETIRFLCDENLDVDLVHALRRTRPTMDILTADEASTLHLPDPLVLAHAAKTERVLLSHDEKTMVAEFYAFLASGHHSPELIIIHQNAPFRPTIDDLVLIWEASDPED